MCRFVVRAGPPAPLRPIVFGGGHSLYRQSFTPRELLHGSVNADGWGVVWYADDGMPVRMARPEPIWYETDLPRTLEVIPGSVTLAAIRNATPGIPRTHEATPPIVFERWSFILNGFVPDFRARRREELHRRLPPDLRRSLKGMSDTEALFLLAVAAAREGADLSEALREVVGRVAEGDADEPSHLNMVFADGEGVAVSRWAREGRSNSLYLREVADAQGILVGGWLASEALDDGESWHPVDPGSIVELRPGSPPRIESIGER